MRRPIVEDKPGHHDVERGPIDQGGRDGRDLLAARGGLGRQVPDLHRADRLRRPDRRGATLEHIRAQHRGGTDGPDNLGVAARCNGEKGRAGTRNDNAPAPDYDDFIARLLDRRRQRWRDQTAEPDEFDLIDRSD